MKHLYMAVVLIFVWMSAGAIAQEHKHEEHKEEQKAPTKKAAEPVKSDSMKCCEGMEKMGDMKSGMPMKGDMKAKMDTMKEKMAEKMAEKHTKTQSKESKDDKRQPAKDAHQH